MLSLETVESFCIVSYSINKSVDDLICAKKSVIRRFLSEGKMIDLNDMLFEAKLNKANLRQG